MSLESIRLQKASPPLDLDAIRARHKACVDDSGLIGDFCDICQEDSPCDAIQLLDEVERSKSQDTVARALVGPLVEDLRAEVEQEHCKYTASQEALTEFLTEHREYTEEITRLREALDKIREELADPCGELTLNKLDALARAALHTDDYRAKGGGDE